jgi:hypothetical protein
VGGGEQMSVLKTSVNLKGDLKRRLEWYCEVNDLQPAQAVKMFVIHGLKKYAKCPHVDTPSRTCEVDSNLSLSKDKDAKSESHDFFKGFIKHISFCEIPEALAKQIKDKWKAIKEAEMTAEEMAESYNQYVSDCKRKDDKFKHPQGWIAGHGWERKNTTEELNNEPRGNYDF